MLKGQKEGLFTTDGGQNVLVTFLILIILFALRGFCSGLIDVLDKHFQDVLHLTLAQSGWVQFAHCLGYVIMALPAGWLATKLGYKAGIISGLLLVALGGFWFIPATGIGAFWAYLSGICIVAMGLAFLETIANPYSTVLGARKYAATRINLAQSFSGVRSIFGSFVGAFFFHSKSAEGANAASHALWVPYAGIAVVVVILAIVFYFANVPEIKAEDDFHLDKSTPNPSRSIWLRPHFGMAVIAQFLCVGAQVSICSFFINYMMSHVSEIPFFVDAALQHGPHFLKHLLNDLTDIRTTGEVTFTSQGASNLISMGLLLFLVGRFIGSALLKKFPADRLLALCLTPDYVSSSAVKWAVCPQFVYSGHSFFCPLCSGSSSESSAKSCDWPPPSSRAR
jgi:MFS transporter, FHS family, L-fucose permease